MIRTDTLDEMLDVAELLVHQPLPAGNRIAIVTNAGGPAVMCADTCEAHGLNLPQLSEATQARLREFLPAEASVANPVDMLTAATAEQYAQAIPLFEESFHINPSSDETTNFLKQAQQEQQKIEEQKSRTKVAQTTTTGKPPEPICAAIRSKS